MSASLVGSEMCIRDRARSAASWGGWAPCCPMSTGTSRETSTRRAGWPVSYTHLTLPTICSV
eukprot:6182278-Alexandrium_andersonii.AAC.1